jgi:predicted GNAT family acetyltransferase
MFLKAKDIDLDMTSKDTDLRGQGFGKDMDLSVM